MAALGHAAPSERPERGAALEIDARGRDATDSAGPRVMDGRGDEVNATQCRLHDDAGWRTPDGSAPTKTLWGAERLCAFSDAAFSIFATVNVVSLAKLPEDDLRRDQWFVFSNLMSRVGLFVLGFLVVGIFWAWHSLAFRDVEVIDRNTRNANTAFLITCSLLPVTSALTSQFGGLTACVTYSSLFCIVLISAAYLRHTLRHKKHQYHQFPGRYAFDLKIQFVQICCSALVPGACVLLNQIHPGAEVAGFLVYGLLPCTRLLMLRLLQNDQASDASSSLLPSSSDATEGGPGGEALVRVPQARVEAFTDGVYAIAATLVVLEIKVPSAGDFNPTWHSLWEAMGGDVVNYAIAAGIIFTKWSVHHQLVSATRNGVPVKLIVFNHLMCLSVALVPVMVSFASEKDSVAAQVFMMITTGVLSLSEIGYLLRGGALQEACHGGRCGGARRSVLHLQDHTARYTPFILRSITPFVCISVSCVLAGFGIGLELYGFLAAGAIVVVVDVWEAIRVEAARGRQQRAETVIRTLERVGGSVSRK